MTVASVRGGNLLNHYFRKNIMADTDSVNKQLGIFSEFKPMVWESFNFTELTWLPYNTNSTQYQSQSSPGQQQQSSPGQQQSSTGQQQQSSGPVSQSQSNSTGTQQQKQ